MVAPIPPGAAWAGPINTDQGTIRHDTVANRVRWSIGELKAGTVPPTATFEIDVTPTANDIGKFADILGPATVSAIDQITDATITAEAPELTTEIPNDTHAQNKGVVTEPNPES